MHQQLTPNSGNITDFLKFNPSLSHLVPISFVLSKPRSMSQAVDFAANHFDGPWGLECAFSLAAPKANHADSSSVRRQQPSLALFPVFTPRSPA